MVDIAPVFRYAVYSGINWEYSAAEFACGKSFFVAKPCAGCYNQRQDGTKLRDERLPWHPGFVEGLMGTFDRYGGELDFLPERQLSKEPLRIDVVVIRKHPELVIELDIGRIFRGHNIFEYKSPTDYVSVGDFKKACAYAWLYSAETGAEMNDITLSFVSASRPVALLAYCKHTLGYTVEERRPGIYYINGGFVPMQAIECRKLNGDENLWLRNLRNDIGVEDLEKLLMMLAKRGGIEKRRAYLNTVLAANAGALRGERHVHDTGTARRNS
jgi:hypothetical protein